MGTRGDGNLSYADLDEREDEFVGGTGQKDWGVLWWAAVYVHGWEWRELVGLLDGVGGNGL